jgi:integrase
VGAYCKAVQGSGALRVQTFLNYQNSLRTIVATIFGIRAGKEKFDYKKGGAQRWQSRIDSIRLDRITDERVRAWQRKFVAAAGMSPVAVEAAKRTANSYLRCARCLFSPKIIPNLKGLTLPSKLPLLGVALLDSSSKKYISKVNTSALITAAKNELSPVDPEAYKVFLLGLFAGLRKGEIDLLEWSMVDFRTGAILLEQTEWLHLKTADSAGMIPIDPELVGELRLFFAQSSSGFVIASDRPPRNDSSRAYYRCKAVFDRLTSWLRSKGVTANKPLHEMRKEIGAQIATQHGIYAASRFLRHSDIGTTANHYADQKNRVSVGLGRLLDTTPKPVRELA